MALPGVDDVPAAASTQRTQPGRVDDARTQQTANENFAAIKGLMGAVTPLKGIGRR